MTSVRGHPPQKAMMKAVMSVERFCIWARTPSEMRARMSAASFARRALRAPADGGGSSTVRQQAQGSAGACAQRNNARRTRRARREKREGTLSRRTGTGELCRRACRLLRVVKVRHLLPQRRGERELPRPDNHPLADNPAAVLVEDRAAGNAAADREEDQRPELRVPGHLLGPVELCVRRRRVDSELS